MFSLNECLLTEWQLALTQAMFEGALEQGQPTMNANEETSVLMGNNSIKFLSAYLFHQDIAKSLGNHYHTMCLRLHGPVLIDVQLC